MDDGFTWLFFVDRALLYLIVVMAVSVVAVRNLLAATMLYGIYSLLMALLWVTLYAMDVAFTEAAVGAGISTILLLGALVSTGSELKPARLVHWEALVVVTITGAALIYGSLDMPPFGDPKARPHLYVSPEYKAERVGKVGAPPLPPGEDDFDDHVPNVVTAVLADYRAYDTMFEAAVIFSAGLCLILLLRRPSDSGTPSRRGSSGAG